MEECKYFTVDKLKVGVISDSQMSPLSWKKNTIFEDNLIYALETFKKNNCSMIIFAGDICNKASKVAYERYLNCYRKVYGDKLPIIQHVMGNHDYYNLLGEKYARKLFEKMLGQSPYTHYVINGYHFIGASPKNCSMTSAYNGIQDWLDKNIKIAEIDSQNKPIFITTHNSPQNTTYGSEDWGDISLNSIFSRYQNIVNFAGHSHYSILDERSMYNGKYTALSTQSVSYIELEKGKCNGTIPPMAYNYPMGYILDFVDNKVYAHRVDLKRNIYLKENSLWQIFPFEKNGKILKNNLDFVDYDISYRIVNDLTELVFVYPKCNDFVHSYKIIINNTITQYYFSDYYMGCDSDKNKQRIILYNIPRGFYNIKIFAVDSYQNESENYLEINNVPVIKKVKYKKVQTPEKRNYRI